MTITVAVVGASGKMGQLISRLIEDAPDLALGPQLRSTDPLETMLGADLVVDVTAPAVSQDIVDFAVEHGISVLVGTSGWSSDRLISLQRRVEAQNAADAPELGVIVIPNFSLGSVLATSFAVMAARFFDSIEIVEAHQAAKVDSPSGTAVRTAELIGNARAAIGPVIAPHSDQRARGQQVSSVPIHSLRLGGVVAKQDVIFGGTGETLTLTHETLASSSYEAGILLALRALPAARGLTVGLDKLIELGTPSPADPAPVETE